MRFSMGLAEGYSQSRYDYVITPNLERLIQHYRDPQLRALHHYVFD